MTLLYGAEYSLGYAAEIDGAVAGFHAILSISLNALAAARNPTVTFHELMHERILMRTPDGLTHLRLKQLSVATTAGDDTREWASHWCREIEEASVIAHETIATFCSVKQVDVEEQQPAIAALPPDYLTWFRSLSDRIDSIFHASYVQYLLAWFIAELCFSSPFSQRITSERPGNPIGLSEYEKPNWRLSLILEAFSEDAMTQLLKNLKASAEIDIQSETAWATLPLEKRMALDSALSKIIRDWGAQKDFGVDTSMAYADWGVLTGNVASHIDELECGGTRVSWLTHQEAEASRLSETTLINRRLNRPENPDALSKEQLSQFSEELPAKLLIATAHFSGAFADRQWLIALEPLKSGSQGLLAGGMTSTEGLGHLLQMRKEKIGSGHRQMPLSTFLIGVNTQHELADHMRHLHPLMSDSTGNLPPVSYGWDWLLWYISGDYISLIKSISDASDHIAFLAVPLSFRSAGNIGVGGAPGASEPFDLVLHIAHTTKTGNEARFVRILNPLASGYAFSAEDEIIKKGKATRRRLSEFSDDTMSQFARIVGLIEAIWPEY